MLRSCMDFIRDHLDPATVDGRSVVEVGSLDFGAVRSYVESLGPASYVGVDIEDGPGVDVVCPVESLVERFGADSFDVVVCVEVLEHVRDWRAAVTNLKQVVAPGGHLVVTTRSQGFPYHAYPQDCWRYEVDDAATIFADMEIESLVADPLAPGVLLFARKPTDFAPAPLDDVALYSMLTGDRQLEVRPLDRVRGVRSLLLTGVDLARPVVRRIVPARLRRPLSARLSTRVR